MKEIKGKQIEKCYRLKENSREQKGQLKEN
jgi:hypothetical protein